MLSGPSGKVNGSEINANFSFKNIYVIIVVVPMYVRGQLSEPGSPLPLWVPGTELGSSGCVTITVNHQAIFVALQFSHS